MEVFENMEDRLEIERRSLEARMTQNGKKRDASWSLVPLLTKIEQNWTTNIYNLNKKKVYTSIKANTQKPEGNVGGTLHPPLSWCVWHTPHLKSGPLGFEGDCTNAALF